MRKTTTAIGLLLLLLSAGAAAGQTPAEKRFQEVKLLIFDRNWEKALAGIEELLAAHPGSPAARQALFYKGECLANLKGREQEAVRAYQDYIRTPDAAPGLVEQAEGAIIDLAFSLFERGDRAALGELEARLAAANKVVRYYAAYKLSLVGDRRAARKAVPVLEGIIRTEKDPELVDRARIALLRVSPESLKGVEDRSGTDKAGAMFRIRVTKKGQKQPVISINIPWSLADLAIQAIPEEDKAAIRRKGYDLNRIMAELAGSGESLVRIEEEDTVIEIWVEKKKEAK
jgi:hypothetical protein